MTIMIIGGSGFIGSKVVKILTRGCANSIGDNIICCDIIQPSTIDEGEWIRANILELASIERILFEYNVETIIHLVGLPEIGYCERNPHFSFLLNVVSVQNTLEAMRKADVKKIIFSSSAAVYGNYLNKPVKEDDTTAPNTIYGYHKLMAEQAIMSYGKSYGMHFVIFRLFNVYGGDPHIGKDVISIFIRNAIRNKPIVVRGPRKFRDFVHVDDVARAFMSAILKEDICNEIINIGSGDKVTIGDIAQCIKEYFPKVNVVEEKTIDDGTGIYADISKAIALLRFDPLKPGNGIREHIAKYSVRRL